MGGDFRLWLPGAASLTWEMPALHREVGHRLWAQDGWGRPGQMQVASLRDGRLSPGREQGTQRDWHSALEQGKGEGVGLRVCRNLQERV